MLVKSILIASILFLNFSSQCNGVKWLALHRLNYHWNHSTDCPSSKERRKEFGLIAYQSLLCKRMPELMPPIIEAAKISVELCQHIFSDRRWNCSSINEVPRLTPELLSGTKEQAFIYALSSAAITWSVAKMCASGEIKNCPCGHKSEMTKRSSSLLKSMGHFDMKETSKEVPYHWKGCSDNVVYGQKVSREWADAIWRSKMARSNAAKKWMNLNGVKKRKVDMSPLNIQPDEKAKRPTTFGFEFPNIEQQHFHYERSTRARNDVFLLKNSAKMQMGLQNNEIGREIIEQNLKRKCRCHGLSGSCDLQSCWYSVPSFQEIAKRLKRKYDAAEYLPVENSGNPVRRWQPQRYTDEDDGLPTLVYMQASSSYCDRDLTRGSIGTHMRECNASYHGTSSCESLCCARGFNIQQVRVEEQCQCQFVYCCYVRCKKCVKIVERHYCK